MKLNNQLFQASEEAAARVTVESLTLGLGYCLVVTSDGGMGLSYTYFENKEGCMLNDADQDPEGQPALDLLQKIFNDDPLQRSMALALINALNYYRVKTLPEQSDNKRGLIDELGIRRGTHVAMVGLFKPLVPLIEKHGGQVEVLDRNKQVGDPDRFYQKLVSWAEVLILSATTILNQTCEDILGHVGRSTKTLLLGPSTPMIPEAFAHLPVHWLAGMVPISKERSMKAVRHGAGTPVLQKFGRKVMLATAQGRRFYKKA